MIRAILMDFNGVIINDEPLHLKAYQEVLKDEGIDLTEGSYYACAGMDDLTFLREQFKLVSKNLTEEKILELTQKKTAAWRGFLEKGVPLFEGVENFIKKCEKRFALGLVSMAAREEINHVLDLTDLRNCFDVVISAEDVSACKPDPESYKSAFRQIDQIRTAQNHYPLLREECLVIEDAPQGIAAGKAAGMKTLGVTNTFDAETLRQAGADAIAKNLNDWFPDAIVEVFSKTNS